MTTVPLALLLLLASPATAKDDATYDVARAHSAAASLTASVTSALSKQPHAEVLSQADVRTMLSVEAERAVMGCDDESSCLAEISDALGARYVVSTRLSRVEERLTLTVSLFDSTAARVAGRQTVEGADVDDLMQKIPFIVGQVWPQDADAEDQLRVYVRDAAVDAAVFPLYAPSVVSSRAVKWLQLAVGPGVALVTGLIPCTWGCAPLLLPGPLTLLMVWLGNWLGPDLGTLGWPMLIAFAVAIVAGFIPFVIFAPVLFYSTAWLSRLDTAASAGQNVDNEQALATVVWFGSILGGVCAPTIGTAAGVATVPFTAATWSAPKRFGETGESMPDWFLDAAPSAEVPPPAASATAQLRY